jgi:hypothetical protein
LIAEAGLRLVGYSTGNFYRRDDLIGVTHRPGAEGWWTREGRDYIRINSDGLRDREHPIAKPANTFRIAILGDSYAEAIQLPMQLAFWSIMESRLQSCAAVANERVEVINFGVSGYGTAQELLTLREKVWKYDPDVVLLAVTTGNDISDNSRALKRADDLPYFVLANEQLVLDDSFRNSQALRWHRTRLGQAWESLINHSAALQTIREGILAMSDSYHKRTGAANPDEALFNEPYHAPRDAAWNDAWRVTEALIVEINKEVRSKGRQFFLVTLSNPAQVNPDPKYRADFIQQNGISDLFYPDRRIQSLCEREGIASLILAPKLQEYAEHNHVFLHGFEARIGKGHWNERGHALAGELIADWLCPQLSR